MEFIIQKKEEIHQFIERIKRSLQMIKTLSIKQKIQSQQSQSSGQLLSVKLEKLKLFISNSDEDLPALTSQLANNNKLPTILRMYFNDQELLIFKNYNSPQSYLQDKQFQTEIQQIFNQFLQQHPQCIQSQIQIPQKQTQLKENQVSSLKKQEENAPTQKKSQFSKTQVKKIDFIEFVQFWIQKQQNLNVFYDKYNDIVKDSVDHFKEDLIRSVSSNVSRQNSAKQTNPTSIQPQNQLHKQNISQKTSRQVQNKTIQVKNGKITDKQNYGLTSEKEQSSQPSNMQAKKPQSGEFKQQIKIKVNKVGPKISLKSNYEQQALTQAYEKQSEDKQYKREDSVRSVNSELVHEDQPRDTFNYYLHKFYQFFCKKSVNTIKNQQFNKLQHFYNSMNLTKFMMYCKDLKILKLDKQITAKFLQKLFKSNENKEHVLEYEAFAKVVKEILQIIFKQKEQLQTTGFQLIGVKNRPNFAEKMGKLGVIVPLKKIIFSKAQQIRSLSRMVKSKTKQQNLNLKQSKLLKDSAVMNGGMKNGGYGHGYQSSWDSNNLQKDLFMNQKQRKQQKLLQNLTIPKLNKLQPSKQIDDKMQEFVDDEYDPYLKRYNDRNNSFHEGNANNHGMMKRIDERIQNVVRKIR